MDEIEGDEDNGSSILAFCEFDEQIHAMTVKKDTSVNDMLFSLSERWDGFSQSTMKLHYIHPVEKFPVSIMKDDDVKHMCTIHRMLQRSMCKIVATFEDKQNKRRRVDQHRVSERDDEPNNNSAPIATVIWGRAIQGEGQMFNDPDHFRRVLKNYCISIKRGFKYVRNDKLKIIASCNVMGCGWRIYASFHKGNQSFGIRRCNLEHTCGLDNLMDRDHPKADAGWIASYIKDRIRLDPNYKPSQAIVDIKKDFGVVIKYKKAWNAREIALRDIHGRDKDSFDKLRWFCEAVKSTNPGSVADLEIFHATMKFRRVFIAFAACLVGFVRGCRPLLFLDGTHIKSKWKGCLLSAVTKDGDGGLFSIAFAVVDAENDDNWDWFCKKLKAAIYTQNGENVWDKYTIFSDRHSGLMKSIPTVFEGSRHAICVRHLVDNFKNQILKKYRYNNNNYWTSVLNKAAYTATYSEFEKHVNAITSAMPLAHNFIVNSEPKRWANAVFEGNRWGIVNNNIAESWNSWVKVARSLPPLAMVDTIRRQIMKMMNEKRESSMRMIGELCPAPEKIVMANNMEAQNMSLLGASGYVFEVHDLEKTRVVNLEQKTCTCGYWQLLRLPCQHACACIQSLHQRVYDYCDPYYRVEAYQKAYSGFIFPIPNEGVPESNNSDMGFVHAPDVRTQPGRRKSKRYPSQVESSNLKCSLCKKCGHNRRTCREARVQG